jgi:hypothetical protein
MDNTNSMMERLDEFLLDVQKPSRYIGGETGSVVKDKSKVDIRFAFCFPDTYEIGMSHLGMKILYGLKNAVPNYWCERVFMPLPIWRSRCAPVIYRCTRWKASTR